MKKLLLIICFVSLPTLGQVQKSLVGFQGIPWGTPLTGVKTKFPNAKVDDICEWVKKFNDGDDAGYRKRAKDANQSCRSLEIEDYNIDGVSFRAAFTFNNAEKLQRVNIIKTFNSGDYLKECNVLFSKMTNLLDLRYGSHTDGVSPESVFPYKTSIINVWLPLPTEIWIASSSGGEVPYANKCEVRISYSKRISEGASKL